MFWNTTGKEVAWWLQERAGTQKVARSLQLLSFYALCFTLRLELSLADAWSNLQGVFLVAATTSP
jgi:hypothetical protein